MIVYLLNNIKKLTVILNRQNFGSAFFYHIAVTYLDKLMKLWDD